MDRRREGRDNLFDMGEPFGGFRHFGSFGSHVPSLFGGRDPFDDPFFTRPFGSMFESPDSGPRDNSVLASKSSSSKGIVIEALNSDDEDNQNEGKVNESEINNCKKSPVVEHPDDVAKNIVGKNKALSLRSDSKSAVGAPQHTRSYSMQTCRVSYGGVDGTYYTSTRTRGTGSDGVMLEETKEADKTSGKATHRISRGIHDKGHSVTRKLNSDGKVDTMQTLHNLNEDELAGFEEAWKGNTKANFPGWTTGQGPQENAGTSRGEWRGQPGWGKEKLHRTGSFGQGSDSSRDGRTKKVVRINID